MQTICLCFKIPCVYFHPVQNMCPWGFGPRVGWTWGLLSWVAFLGVSDRGFLSGPRNECLCAFRRCQKLDGHKTPDGSRCVPRRPASPAVEMTRSAAAGGLDRDRASSDESWPTTSQSSPYTRRGATTPENLCSSNARKLPKCVRLVCLLSSFNKPQHKIAMKC